MKYIFLALVAVIGVTAFGFAARILLFPVNTATKMIDTAYDAQDKVLNAENAIYNYEWFKQKYQDIEVAKKQHASAVISHAQFQESMPESRIDWTFEDKNEDARLSTVVLGLRNHLDSLIGDYNARASMATRNIFENSILPNYIDALTFITK